MGGGSPEAYIWTAECLYGVYSACKNSSPSPRGLCGQGRPPKTQNPTSPALHIEHSLLFRFFIKLFPFFRRPRRATNEPVVSFSRLRILLTYFSLDMRVFPRAYRFFFYL